MLLQKVEVLETAAQEDMCMKGWRAERPDQKFSIKINKQTQ